MTKEEGLIHWVTKSAAGLRQPGLHGELAADLTSVRRAGIDVLVALTMEPLPQHQLLLRGLDGRHFPIVGMGVPSVAAALALCDELALKVRLGSKVAFHCAAGVGSTGMMLACHLVSRGMQAEDAIARVRGSIPRAIQAPGQEAFVHQLAAASNGRAQRGRGA